MKTNRLLINVLVVFCFTSSMAMAVTPTSVEKEQRENVLTSQRILRGDLVSLGSDRVLKTSVGNYKLPDAAQVVDRRSNRDGQGKVSIQFRGDFIVEVTIY